MDMYRKALQELAAITSHMPVAADLVGQRIHFRTPMCETDAHSVDVSLVAAVVRPGTELHRVAQCLHSLGVDVVALGEVKNDRASLFVSTKGPEVPGHAGNLIAAMAPHVGGRGGGRQNIAQAGGDNLDGLPKAIAAASSALASMLGLPFPAAN